MNLSDVEKIIQMFEKSNVNTIDLEIDNIKIKLEKNIVFKTVIILSSSNNIKFIITIRQILFNNTDFEL